MVERKSVIQGSFATPYSRLYQPDPAPVAAIMARIFRGLDTGRVSQLWGDFVVKVVGCLARVVVELFERAVDAAQSERRLPTVVSAVPGAACSPSGPPLAIGLLVVGISRLTVLASGARTAPN